MSETKRVPAGYRMARKGEKLVPGAIFRDRSGSKWYYDLVSADGRIVDGPGAALSGKMAYAFPLPKPIQKPANKPAPAKWTPIPADTKLTKAKIIEMANKLGAENARLKNKLAKGVG